MTGFLLCKVDGGQDMRSTIILINTFFDFLIGDSDTIGFNPSPVSSNASNLLLDWGATASPAFWSCSTAPPIPLPLQSLWWTWALPFTFLVGHDVEGLWWCFWDWDAMTSHESEGYRVKKVKIQGGKFVCIFFIPTMWEMYISKDTQQYIICQWRQLETDMNLKCPNESYSIFLGAQAVPVESKLLHCCCFENCFEGERKGHFIIKLAGSGGNCLEGTGQERGPKSGRLSAYLWSNAIMSLWVYMDVEHLASLHSSSNLTSYFHSFARGLRLLKYEVNWVSMIELPGEYKKRIFTCRKSVTPPGSMLPSPHACTIKPLSSGGGWSTPSGLS